MMPLSVFVLAAGGLTDIDKGLFLWTLVLFVLFAIVMGKFGWKPLLQMIEERERGVRDAVEGAQKANTEAQALLNQHKDMVREAGREREEIIKRALKEAEEVRAQLTSKARVESEQLLERAKQQIDREKTVTIQALRAQVADLAVEAASKIVRSSMTPEAQRRLVDDFVRDLPRLK